MKKIPRTGILIASLILVVVAINLFFQVPQGEGFNPSDDGVILAQSYRIINGEVPHVDFISIRPVGSAIFHSLSFAIPFPLEVAARWLCLLEYLLISLLWSWLLFKTLPLRNQKPYILLLISTLAFVLNQNFYNLFPWTTIDAIFFFSLGFFIYWNWKDSKLSRRLSAVRYFMIIFFIGYSALCRQTFALPVLVLGILSLTESVKRRQLTSMLLGGLVGLTPYWIYLTSLIKENALNDFYHQLTGRTEIWETGINQFGQQFWNSPFLAIYLIIFVLFLFLKLETKKEVGGKVNVFLRPISVWVNFILLSGIVVLIFVNTTHLFSYSFVLFWIYILMLICGSMFISEGWRKVSLHWWIIFLAWTSSISLGDNSPVFTTGLLGGGILVLMLQQLYAVYQSKKYFRSYNWILVLLSAALLGVSVYVQKENNYRDLRAANLKFQMTSFLPDMGGIKTNSRTYAYMLEMYEIFENLGNSRGRFVALPNASLIYPMLDSRNPMPIDWMQGPEFVGQEDELLERLRLLDKGDGIYLLFDKYNSKLLSDSLVEMDYQSGQYPYYNYLLENSYPVQGFSSDWFDIRLWK